MIERIVAICQTKEDQQTWVDLIRQQIRSVRVSSASTSPSHRPQPPPHNSVSCKSTPYSRLAAYFARLVRKGVITRKLLKLLLYNEFKDVNTQFVKRRRRDRKSHRVECVIYPQEPVRTWITETESSECEYSGRESKSGMESSMSCDQSGTSSCFGFVRGPYRSTLTISRPGGGGCADLSRMDSSTTMPHALGTHNKISSHYLSLPVLPKSMFVTSHSSCLALTQKVAEVEKENSPEEDRVAPLHRSYSYHFVQDSSCQCSSSHRSTDSGLADILASPDLATPAPDNSLPADSGNYEAQCLCSSPFGSTPRTSPQPPTTYRSAMYAHWCLKMRIPASAVKQPPGKHTLTNA